MHQFHEFLKMVTVSSIKKLEENENNLILNADYKTYQDWRNLSSKIHELYKMYVEKLEGKNDINETKRIFLFAYDIITRDIDTFQHNLLQLFQERFEIKPDMFDY